jgi:GAF domain-containing protein
MAAEDGLRAAVAAGVVGSGESFRTLLSAVAEVSRQIFGAKASSILLLDEDAKELVFEAVGGYGEEKLIGLRFPAGQGIAGWVLATRTPLILDDVQNDPRFAADFAKGTGYVPQGLMAVPLLHEERALGVLEVLDRPQNSRFSLQEMELLGLFANQSAIALDLLQRARRAEAVLESREDDLGVVAALAETVDGLEGARREAALRLLRALADTL